VKVVNRDVANLEKLVDGIAITVMCGPSEGANA
jgi:hypothetical protein